jgi:hypothetical protein
MKIDYPEAEKIILLAFQKLDQQPRKFPEPGTLAKLVNDALDGGQAAGPTIPHNRCHLLASASVEMWHRAIHSFLWSVAMTDKSPLWASVTGYYSSHFVMRALAHSLGIYKSFTHKTVFQIARQGGGIVCRCHPKPTKKHGEHQFYWQVVKDHPDFVRDSLFSANAEGGVGPRGREKSDYMHRNFANYTDHIDNFSELSFPDVPKITKSIEKIRLSRKNSVELPRRSNYPDHRAIQVLAYQRIVAYREFLDTRVLKTSAFWKAHREPVWARAQMQDYALETEGLSVPGDLSA